MLLALGGCASGYNGLPPNIGFPTAAGFRVVSTTLSPAVAGRTYSFYVLLNGGTAPINCSSGVSGLPANLSATYVTVPTGPVAGTGACLISGTVAATAVAGSPYALTFNLQDTSAPPLTTSAALSLTVRPEFDFNAAVFPVGVQGRTYGANGPTGAAPNMAPVATTTLATGAGNAPLTSCVLSGAAVTANPGIATTPALGANVTACPLMTSAAMTLAAPGVNVPVIFTATDTPIVDPTTGLTAVPAGMVSNTTQAAPPSQAGPVALSLTVNPPLALALDAASAPVNPAPDGVVGRSYGNTGVGLKDLAFDATGGLPAYIFGLPSSVALPAANGVPAAVACTPNGADTIAACTSGASTITAAAGAYPFSISLNDTANTAVPSASASGTQPMAIPGMVTVQSPLVTVVNLTPQPTAVIGRTYGSPGLSTCGANGTTACQNLVFTATGGIGNMPMLAITGNPNTPASVGITCTASAPVANTPTTDTCNSGAVTMPAGNVIFIVTASDVADATTPAGTNASDTNRFVNATIIVNAALALTLDTGPNSLAAVNPAPDAVQGRSYGNTAAGLKDPAFDATQGLPPYVFGLPAPAAMPGGNVVPNPVMCTANVADTIASCTSGASVIPNTTATGAYMFSITLNDTGNVATPSASASATQPAAIPGSITVDPALTITAALPSPMAPWTVNPANPYPTVTVTAMTGLPATQTNYSCLQTTALVTTFGLTVTFSLPMPNMPSCSVSGKPNFAGTAAVTVTIQDTGDLAVPAGSITSPSPASSLTIHPQPAFATTTLPDGVTDNDGAPADPRPYGPTAGSTVTISGVNTGTPPFALASTTGLNAGNCAGLMPGAFTMASGSLVISGTPSFVTTPGVAVQCMFTINEADSSGTAVAPSTITITIQPPLRINPNLNLTTQAVAVDGRTYGVAPQMPLIFTATGGIAPQTVTFNNALTPAPTGITCTASANMLTCATAGATTVSGMTSVLTVNATDSTNTATTATDSISPSETITVNPAITVTSPARIPNALEGFVYPTPPSTAPTFTATGGLMPPTFTALVWSVGATNGSGVCAAVAGQTLTGSGLTLDPAAATVTSGGAAITQGDIGVYTFQACAQDAGDMTTPSGSGTSASPFTVDVLPALAVASGTGSSTVEAVDYVTNLYYGHSNIAGATPSGIAVTSDGSVIFVADNANNKIIAIDTITGTTLAGSPFGTVPNCGLPTELATTPDPVAAGHDRLYVVCTDTSGTNVEEVGVLDTSNVRGGTLGVFAALPTGPGSAPTAVAIQSDNSHAFVTLNGFNTLFVVDNTLAFPKPVTSSPFTLDANTSQPTGIAVTANGGGVYAYMGKQGFGNQPTTPSAIATATAAGTTVTTTTTGANGFVSGETVVIAGSGDATFDGTFVITVTSPTTFTYTDPTVDAGPSAGGTATLENQQGIEVVDVTNVGTFGTAGTTTLVTDILLTPGALPNPDDVAVDPTNAFVYVTFPGTDQFTVVANTNPATPAQVAGNPFGLPDPSMAGTDMPGGVTVPPVPLGSVLAYFTAHNMAQVDVVTQGTPPTKDLSITGLTAGSAPGRIKHIPIPQ